MADELDALQREVDADFEHIEAEDGPLSDLAKEFILGYALSLEPDINGAPDLWRAYAAWKKAIADASG
jgi:hypothetical protein